MKAIDTERDFMRADYIEQLNELGFYETSNLSDEDLKAKVSNREVQKDRS